MELAYMFQSLSFAPRDVLLSQMFPRIESEVMRLREIAENIEKSGGSSEKGFWDDFCLARFLEGVCWRFVAYPVSPQITRYFLFRSCGCCAHAEYGAKGEEQWEC